MASKSPIQNQTANQADALYQKLLGSNNADYGNIGEDFGTFDSLMAGNNLMQGVNQSSSDMLTRANDQKEKMNQLNAQAQQVTQKNMEDSIKVGMANLLAKSYNMLTQSHLSLAKEAIEVAKTSV